MQPVLKAADVIWRQLGKTLVVVHGRDGLHSAGSYHYYGYAVDLRTNYFSDKGELAHQQLKAKLRSLSPFYDVVNHGTHIHVEFDYWRHKGLNSLKRAV